MSDAPKVIYLHHAEMVKNDDTQCLVFTIPAPLNFTKHQSRYHHDDTVTALQAEIERLRGSLSEISALIGSARAMGAVSLGMSHAIVSKVDSITRAALQQET
ncbi:MAG: hypothetical protein KAI82_03875 [Tritonibacter mobilis]|nr:hypothetical protein [Tritonibacter mobilis]